MNSRAAETGAMESRAWEGCAGGCALFVQLLDLGGAWKENYHLLIQVQCNIPWDTLTRKMLQPHSGLDWASWNTSTMCFDKTTRYETSSTWCTAFYCEQDNLCNTLLSVFVSNKLFHLASSCMRVLWLIIHNKLTSIHPQLSSSFEWHIGVLPEHLH